MNLHHLLLQRAAQRQAAARRADRRRQVRLDVPVAGAHHARACTSSRWRTFRRTARARRSRRTGWPAERIDARSFADARRSAARRSSPTTRRGDRRCRRPRSSSTRPAIPPPASRTCSRAARNGKHIVMVNVEADALAGPLLARARGARPASSTRSPTATSRR